MTSSLECGEPEHPALVDRMFESLDESLRSPLAATLPEVVPRGGRADAKVAGQPVSQM